MKDKDAVVCKIYNKSGNVLPEYASERAAGLDLRASLAHMVTITPGERMLIPTGLYIELPENCEAQVRPRSGLAVKHGITVLNTPGTIDADYRGELKILLVNLSQEPFEIHNGDRIAQMVISQVCRVKLQSVDTLDNLSDTCRKAGGFGHSGTK